MEKTYNLWEGGRGGEGADGGMGVADSIPYAQLRGGSRTSPRRGRQSLAGGTYPIF